MHADGDDIPLVDVVCKHTFLNQLMFHFPYSPVPYVHKPSNSIITRVFHMGKPNQLIRLLPDIVDQTGDVFLLIRTMLVIHIVPSV